MPTKSQPTEAPPVDRFPDWTPKQGDPVTTALRFGMFGTLCQGFIQEVRPPKDKQLPIKVGGFWFEKHELTPLPPNHIFVRDDLNNKPTMPTPKEDTE